MERPAVAIVHDYLTQRGGAERVVLSMARAWPDASIHTSLYEPRETFPEFSAHLIHRSSLDRVNLLRRHHRLAFGLLGPVFSRWTIDAAAVVCSSSGWAHMVDTTGKKIVYCYTPARWLYQTDRYFGGRWSVGRMALEVLRPYLAATDRAAAKSATIYLTQSRITQERIEQCYGIQSQIVAPPWTIDPSGNQEPVLGLEPGYLLLVSRILEYKNIHVVASAFERLKGYQLVVVGTGPLLRRQRLVAPSNVRYLGAVTDAQLRWLYHNCVGLIAPAFEDYGLTPLEAAAFGKPSLALRWGGYLDTVLEGTTGMFVDAPDDAPDLASIERGVRDLVRRSWSSPSILAHAQLFNETTFIARLRDIVTTA